MEKDFDTWNVLKKNIHSQHTGPFCNTREIWWASLGLNIGSEEDGKNKLFERPVLIIKVFNREMIRVIPITSAIKEDTYHASIEYESMSGSVKLSQLKTISTKRLSRKICRLDTKNFTPIIEKLLRSIT